MEHFKKKEKRENKTGREKEREEGRKGRIRRKAVEFVSMSNKSGQAQVDIIIKTTTTTTTTLSLSLSLFFCVYLLSEERNDLPNISTFRHLPIVGHRQHPPREQPMYSKSLASTPVLPTPAFVFFPLNLNPKHGSS